MTSHAATRLTYFGPALDTNTMDVRALAPALLAFGDLCEETAKILFGKDTKTRVEVKGSFKTGSFGVDLSIVTDLLQQVIGWLASDPATAIGNATAIVAVLTGASGGLIKVLKWQKGRPLKRVEVQNEGRNFITEDGDSLFVEERVVSLYRSRTVRVNLHKVVEPVELDGISSLSFGDDESITTSIEKNEAPYFRPPEIEDHTLTERVSTMVFSIISLSFKEDNKWRLHDGQSIVSVAIADAEFVDRVNRNIERFAKNDLLIAETKIKQWESADGLKSEYTILRVIEHLSLIHI